MTVVIGCLARSVRDVCRWFDVANGFDSRDPYSLPRVDGWERGLGSYDLKAKRVAIAPTLGNAIVRDEVQERVVAAAEALARDAGLEVVDVDITLPTLDVTWAMANLAGLKMELGDLWPDCKDDLTTSIAFGLEMATSMTTLDVVAAGERSRTESNEAMADVFDQVDFVMCATNPDVAFPAEIEVNSRVGDLSVAVGNNGALTIPANISGNPAISIPVEPFEGLPVGLQVIGRHHQDALLLDLARIVEQERPWPLVVD
jgi:aspartyl-tRNA(Asn)/glutamyl-tRNA(Gln) amidotransferase subunit A